MVYSRAGPFSEIIRGRTKNYLPDFDGAIKLKIPNNPDQYAGLFGDPYLELACAIAHASASSGHIDEITLVIDEHMQERGYSECSIPLIKSIIETAARERPEFCDNHLQNIRVSRNMKQKQLCKLTGITQSRMSEYETQDIYPSAENCKKIAEALEVEESEIWQL